MTDGPDQTARLCAPYAIEDVPRGLDLIELEFTSALRAMQGGRRAGAQVAASVAMEAVAATRASYVAERQALRDALTHADGLLNDPDGVFHAYAWLKLAFERVLGFPA